MGPGLDCSGVRCVQVAGFCEHGDETPSSSSSSVTLQPGVGLGLL